MTKVSSDSSESRSVYYSISPNNDRIDSIKCNTGNNRSLNSLSMISIGASDSESTESFKSITSNGDGTIRVKRRSFDQIVDGLKIDMIKCTEHDANSVVLVSASTNLNNGPEFTDGYVNLKRPIYQFKDSINWGNASRIIQSDVSIYGIYLAGVWWNLRDKYQFAFNNKKLDKVKVCVLHCVTKEPANKFRGRIGPISSFVPRIRSDNQKISGIWVSLLQDKILSSYVNPLLFLNESYRDKLQTIDKNVNQVLFFVSNEAACVGIQIMNTKKEEKQIRKSKVEFHHERPLILEDGFILVEGIFKTNCINTNRANTNGDSNNIHNTNGKNLDLSSGAKIVIIGEGTHLIRTITETIDSLNVSDLLASSSPIVPRSSSPTKIKSNKKNKKNRNKTQHADNRPSLSPNPFSQTSSSVQQNSAQNTTKKIRTVEVCFDGRYQTQIITVDYNQIKQDLKLE